MLFMGSSKYSGINEFSDFIANNDGDSDAFTGAEETSYYFQVSNEAFEKALGVFAYSFISPIFDKTAVIKAAEAINSEFGKNSQSPNGRLKYLSQVLSDSSHPFSQFLTGSYQRLMVNAQMHNINIIDALKKFHDQYYSANIMTLTVSSNQPLDNLEKLVTDTFPKIPNKNFQILSLKGLGSPLAKRKGTYKSQLIMKYAKYHINDPSIRNPKKCSAK